MSKPFLSAVSLACLGLLAVVAAACTTTTETPVPPAAPTSVSPTAATAGSIQDIVWHWTSVTTKPTGETTTVSDPQNYTIVFRDDGTLRGKADCNSFTGTYTEEAGLTIALGATTMAYCGDASMDQQYLQLLGAVVSGGPDGEGNLALENAGGEKRMLFENGGAAPAQ